MSYYNWEQIVKRKSIGELKQIIRDRKSDDEVAILAKAELEIRRQRESSSAGRQRLVDKIMLLSIILGVFQLIGAFLNGICLIGNIILSSEKYLNLKFIIPALLVTLLSFAAGISILTKNKRIILTKVNQWLQLIHIKTSAITFYYCSFPSILVGLNLRPNNPVGMELFRFQSQMDFDLMNNEVGRSAFIYFNVLSLVALYLVSKLGVLMKKRETIISNQKTQ